MATKKTVKKIKRTKKSTPRKSASKKALVDDMNFVLKQLGLPIIVIDAQAKVRRFNDAWIQMFGEEGVKDYTGYDYFKLLNELQKRKYYSPQIKDKITEIIEKGMAGNFRPKFLEFPIKQGWFLSHMHPVHTVDKLEGFIITHHDVTIWKEKELALQKERNETFENSQRRMFFLANLNHELKSPLNSIMGFSQLLREQIETNEHLSNYVGFIDNIAEGASHLNSIVFRILNMAKIESGTLLLQEEEVAPEKLIQLSLNIIRPMFPNRNIQTVIAPDTGKKTLRCDKNLAMEVLMNLLVNALKFSHETVQMFCAPDEAGNLVFEVKDHGRGMTPKEVDIALEPFGQNIRSPMDKDTGLGLGVPFSNQIMKLHGGNLKIASEKGKGTTVTVCFPVGRIIS